MVNASILSVEKQDMHFRNGVKLNFSGMKAQILSYLELEDRIFIVVWTSIDTKKEEPGYDLGRNIFCYSKDNGQLLWQIEQPWGRNHQPLDAVYKYVGMRISGSDGHWLLPKESGIKMVEHTVDGGTIYGSVYLKPFRRDTDQLETMTLDEFPNEYTIDIDTGKVEWFATHQKV